MRSTSSELVKEGRSTPLACISSVMAGPWFHIAVAIWIGDPYWPRNSRSGPATPPTPATW